MGSAIWTVLSFYPPYKEDLIELAKEYQAKAPFYESDWDREHNTPCYAAEWLLQYIIDGNGYGDGPKGAMFSWGTVTNYTTGEQILNALPEFFQEVLGQRDEVIIFQQHEDSDGFITTYSGYMKETVQNYGPPRQSTWEWTVQQKEIELTWKQIHGWT